MALTFEYQCNGCGESKTNYDLESFVCQCGGVFRLADSAHGGPSCFDSHFNETIGAEVTSWRDMEKKAKSCVSEKHPEGLSIREPNGRAAKELKYIHKHREDYIAAEYKKEGVKYKPGSQVNFSRHKGEFIRRGDDPRKPSASGKVFSFGGR